MSDIISKTPIIEKEHEHRNKLITTYELEGDLCLPKGAKAIVLFAHGSGSSRHSSRNQYVAKMLNDAGIATLLADLLTVSEKDIDSKTRHLRFDVDLLASRIESITNWLKDQKETQDLAIGYFGSSTGAAAALISASKLNNTVKAIVSRGGRSDLVESRLNDLIVPTLFIVGGSDTGVIGMNKRALKLLKHAKVGRMLVIHGAGHLFEEPDKMEEMAKAAVDWFECYLLRTRKTFKNKHGFAGFLPEFKQILHIKFRDRAAAGEMLATLLSNYRNESPLIIGIARGGIVVAEKIARRLSADLDIVISRRLRSPSNSENAIGAITQDGLILLNNNLIQSMNVSKEYVEAEEVEQKKKIECKLAMYRSPKKEYKIKGRTVILVDDGAASGATILVTAEWIKRQGPAKLVIAVPVASPQAMKTLAEEADDFQVIRKPPSFESVEQYYGNFSTVTDERISQIMKCQFFAG